MTTAQPKVSVVIPIYNRAERVHDLVQTLLSQTLTDWEAIFVDDGSETDVAGALAQATNDPRIRYRRIEHNQGVSAARNQGVQQAVAPYVAFLDSDDAWTPEKLAKQLAAVEANGGGAMFCVTLTVIVMPGGWERVRPSFDPKPSQSFAEYLYSDGGFAQASSLMTSRDLALTHPFNEALRQYEDHLFFIDLHAAAAQYLIVREPLTIWRNDLRADRLSAKDNIERGTAFLELAGDLLPPRVQTAFKLRVLGTPIFRKGIFSGLGLAFQALAERAMSPRDVVVLTARRILPDALWDRVRRWAR